MKRGREWREVDTWIFDLDNTLYHPSARLFDQINRRMTEFIAETLSVAASEADLLRKTYWLSHGSTLAGLRQNHRVDPDAFLEHVHRIDLAALSPDPGLAAAIGALPGKRIVHTNGARAHAQRVLAARGLSDAFDAIYGIDDLDFHSKPGREAYGRLAAHHGHDPARSAMIEDSVDNLSEPSRLGMVTVWIDHGDRRPTPGHVDHRVADLHGFLVDLDPATD